ncbi:monovalent cation/H(+) antiporter subunit G [Nocardioides sp. P86]|uniref:monovalent cation/H(+) antiporter subunit G n=1 Tax=Nocardioides sp. P86 TaxID=2939569 RepID=UPI002041FEE1|nr:monovalent cation/H(+) antiporter subunit G [Nocardioides sp. P86]MCM3515049.1 monovalent cation/H(+) antiporter subunit G [Nocardioides sp. P86]
MSALTALTPLAAMTSVPEVAAQVSDVVGSVLLLAGCALSLIAAIGMVRLPDLLTRMHAATKPQVLGLVLVIAGLALRLREPEALGMLVLVVLFQMATAPVAAHMVGRAAFRGDQVDRGRLVVDELSEGVRDLGDEPRGAP